MQHFPETVAPAREMMPIKGRLKAWIDAHKNKAKVWSDYIGQHNKVVVYGLSDHWAVIVFFGPKQIE